MSLVSLGQSHGRGRGIFAVERIESGTTIEVCPVIPISPEHRRIIEQTELFNYYFNWEEDSLSVALCLGYGSIYNHSYHPNARYDKNYADKTISFVAIGPIEAGEEITVNYNGHPHDQTRVWFTAV